VPFWLCGVVFDTVPRDVPSTANASMVPRLVPTFASKTSMDTLLAVVAIFVPGMTNVASIESVVATFS
jgi:hypothetical protein